MESFWKASGTFLPLYSPALIKKFPDKPDQNNIKYLCSKIKYKRIQFTKMYIYEKKLDGSSSIFHTFIFLLRIKGQQKEDHFPSG